ncbi:MAG TPA: hypothetical protein V6C97_34330 [Oculatellaceae cyanobacterium]
MTKNIKIGALVAVIAATGFVSAAKADSYIEERTFSSEALPTTTVTRSETIMNPIVEERMIERPVLIDRAPFVEKYRVSNHGEKVKIKEYYY